MDLKWSEYVHTNPTQVLPTPWNYQVCLGKIGKPNVPKRGKYIFQLVGGFVSTREFQSSKDPHPSASAKTVGFPVFQGCCSAHQPGSLVGNLLYVNKHSWESMRKGNQFFEIDSKFNRKKQLTCGLACLAICCVGWMSGDQKMHGSEMRWVSHGPFLYVDLQVYLVLCFISVGRYHFGLNCFRLYHFKWNHWTMSQTKIWFNSLKLPLEILQFLF